LAAVGRTPYIGITTNTATHPTAYLKSSMPVDGYVQRSRTN
jgi:hypothetical protein